MRKQLDAVISAYRTALALPDPAQIQAILGTILANRLEGHKPVWLVIVGPPSSGKSEPLSYLRGMPDIHSASEVTGPGLLSCSPHHGKRPAGTGGLLTSIGKYGVLVISDLSPTLTMGDERLAQFLSMMRDVYDGHVVRYGGQDGGQTRKWEGKIGLIAASTNEIDRHHSVINTLGDRYLYFRMPATDISEKLARADSKNADYKAVIDSLSDFLASSKNTDKPELPDDMLVMLKGLAKLVAVCRTAVIRDRISREIEHAAEPEEPVRLYKTLKTLACGLIMAGLTESETIGLITRISTDTMPPVRAEIIRLVAESDEPVTISSFTDLRGTFSDCTVRRAFEDLVLYRVIRREGNGNGLPYRYSPSDWLRERLLELGQGDPLRNLS